MATRNHWKRGDWLVIDEESGFTRYASRIVTDYYGKLTDYRRADGPHPQDFIKPLQDPEAVPYSNPFKAALDICDASPFVGNTNIPAKSGPATHLYDPGIGEAEIECTFYVR